VATDLRVLVNTDRGFYPLMGPFLARREVVKAVGGPVWDDDAKTWLVVVRDRQVLGFVAVADRGGPLVVESLWARPGMARVASELVGAAVDRFGGRDMAATVTREAADAYTRNGFAVAGETVNFVKLTREGDGRG
jgi:hypothetical protein